MYRMLNYDTPHLGREVLLYEELDSTNEEIDRLDLVSGAIVVADYQTAGRGQYGRPWNAKPGSSLMMTVQLEPPAHLQRPVILTAWATVSVAEAILELAGLQAKIKWPNDLLLSGRKCCGVLIEQRSRTLVGIGLNLNQTTQDWADAGLPQAVSLSQLAAKTIDRDDALSCVVKHLNSRYDSLLAGKQGRLEADWKWRIGLLGQAVVASLVTGELVAGRLHDMSFAGVELELHGDGGFRVLPPELIRNLTSMKNDYEITIP
jgi:BirA family transcriptional regulator, biotin operon repressor / biotin---[acetyl-CoA-carboxylase] ligase